jgi:hypothetical protein
MFLFGGGSKKSKKSERLDTNPTDTLPTDEGSRSMKQIRTIEQMEIRDLKKRAKEA